MQLVNHLPLLSNYKVIVFLLIFSDFPDSRLEMCSVWMNQSLVSNDRTTLTHKTEFWTAWFSFVHKHNKRFLHLLTAENCTWWSSLLRACRQHVTATANICHIFLQIIWPNFDLVPQQQIFCTQYNLFQFYFLEAKYNYLIIYILFNWGNT